jgi:hypothetical protein
MAFDLSAPLVAQCRQITEDITKDVLSVSFHEMPQLDKSAAETYRACCPNPMCLRTVQSKLKAQQYACVNAWWSDIVLIFDNAIRYNGSLSMIGGIAQYLKGKAERKFERLVCTNSRNYEARLFELTRAIRELLDAPPAELALAPAPTQAMPLIEDFSADRVQRLLEQLNAEVRAGRLAEIEAVLEKCGERVVARENAELDLAGISRRALHALEAYVGGRRA